MYSSGGQDEYEGWDSAYLLGALTAVERRRYEEHFAFCRDCGEAVRDLARLPGTSGRVGRSRRRVALSATALVVAAVLALGTIAGSVLPMASAGQPGGVAMKAATGSGFGTAATDSGALKAQLAVTAAPWGTRFAWSCDYRGLSDAVTDAAAENGYSLVVTGTDGSVQTVAIWAAQGTVATGLTAVTSLQKSAIRSIDIRVNGTNEPLAQLNY